MIADRIIVSLRETAAKRRVVDVRVGLRYTAVLLDDGRAGLAFTCPEEARHGRGLAPNVIGASADLVLRGLVGSDPLGAVVACACANALIDTANLAASKGDAFERLDIRPGDRVGMIGYFPPLVQRLSGTVAELMVFERRPLEGTYPDWSERRLLPSCDVVIITGTALINGTIDSILEWSASAREIAVIGPSTPLLPEVFPEKVRILGGARVIDVPGAMRAISLAAGLSSLKPYIKMITVIRTSPGRS